MNVLTIPAGDSGILVHRHQLYICPHNSVYESKLGNHRYLGFRHLIGSIKGAIDRIYERVKVEDIEFTKSSFTDTIKNHPKLTESEKKVFKEYYLDHKRTFNEWLPISRYLLVFVSEKQILPHKPHPPINNTYWAVYDYDDLLYKTVLDKKN